MRRRLVGLHGRNDSQFAEADFQALGHARIGRVKLMSFTDSAVFQRLAKRRHLITRLYDDRLRDGNHVGPTLFVERMAPEIERVRGWCRLFEIHNEPNHYTGLEGWGPGDAEARAFRAWYAEVYAMLKARFPWASFGFPGLALNWPHRDMEWLDICADVIRASDWLGCHCYWQWGNMMSPDWGLRFTQYHAQFPHLPVYITEIGDSTPGRSPEEIADLYVRYYQKVAEYDYIQTAVAFILSSPDPQWDAFCWRNEDGTFRPVVGAVGAME